MKRTMLFSKSLHQRLALLLLLWLSALPLYAQVSAQVDRQLVSEDETLRLTISAEGDDRDHTPDFSVLEENFNLLGTSQSSQIQIINGQTRSSKQWQITLHPKFSGQLLIPPIQFGQKSTPAISVNVVTASQQSVQTNTDRPIFVESTIDKSNPFVQEQIILTVSLYHKVQIHNGSLSQPEISNAVVEKIGDDVKSRAQKNGQLYDVIERRYAIFPQQSGRLEIPAIMFEGAIPDSRSNQQVPGRGFFSDPFSMMQATQTVRTRSEALSVDVKTIPSNFTGNHWLPANSLRLQEQWSPDDTEFEVGQAITRTIIIIAEGVTSAQLPTLDIPTLDKVSIYPDQSAQENRPSDNGILGLKQQKLALLPNEAGKVSLPEVRIPWWNTQTNRYEVATLPAREINIIASSKTATTLSPSILSEAETQLLKQTETTAKPTTVTQTTSGYWPWLTALFAALWLLTTYLWLKNRKPAQQATAKPPFSDNRISSKQLQKEFREHCQSNNASSARTTLIQWSQQHWPNHTIRTLGDISSLCDNDNYREEIKNLDNALYTQNNHWRGQDLYQAFEIWLNTQTSQPISKNSKELPGLYTKQ